MKAVQPHFFGLPIHRSLNMREGQIVVGADAGVGNVAFAAPLTFWRLQHPGRDPLLSRHCRGLRELERDRRRYPRPAETT